MIAAAPGMSELPEPVADPEPVGFEPPAPSPVSLTLAVAVPLEADVGRIIVPLVELGL